MVLGFQQLPRVGRKARNPVLMADHDPEKYKQPVVYPPSRSKIRLFDMVDGNFDNLFKAAESFSGSRESLDSDMPFSQYLGSDAASLSSAQSVSSSNQRSDTLQRYSNGDSTIYEPYTPSGTITPASSVDSPVSLHRVKHYKLRSLDNMHLSPDSDSPTHLNNMYSRQMSTSDDGSHLITSPFSSYGSEGVKPPSPTSSSVSSGSSSSPQMTRVVRHHRDGFGKLAGSHPETSGSDPNINNNIQSPPAEIKDRYHIGRGIIRVDDRFRMTRASEGDLSREIESLSGW